MQVYIHTIGTSVLTNSLKQGLVKHPTVDNTVGKLLSITNFKEPELSQEDADFLATIRQLDVAGFDRKKMSAELNALYTYESSLSATDTKPNPTQDMHYLLHTDTTTGELAATHLQTMLIQDGYRQVEKVCVQQLSTRNTKHFNQGIKNLFGWLANNLPNFQASNTPIIFNLNGGFKSLQGFMNTAGMFYADKIIYIFESGKEIVEIPKLPLQLDKNSIEPYAHQFLTAEVMSDYLPADLLKAISPIYKEEDDGLATLSAIGLLAWSVYRKYILQENLLNFSHIKYESSFKDDFKSSKRDVIRLQETLAKVNYLLSQSNGNTGVLKDDGGLLYEVYVNTDIGHFRISQETRVSCIKQNNMLVLRHFGGHDYVINPTATKQDCLV